MASKKNNKAYLKNKSLNEKEIADKKVILKSKFRGLGIALTSRCGLSCLMCETYKKPWEIPGRVLKNIKKYMPYLSRLYWQGGEVFLHPGFEELFDEACEYPHLNQEIVTSGLMIDEHWAEKLSQSFLNLIFSIDGVNKYTYEYIRKGASYEKMIESVSLIKKYKDIFKDRLKYPRKMTTSINFVVMKSNYKEMEDMIEFTNEYDFDDLTFTPLYGNFKDENITSDIKIKTETRESLKKIKNKAETYGIMLHSWLPANEEVGVGIKTGEKNNRKKDTNREILCKWPWQHLFIQLGGEVYPNCICPETVGDIKNSSLEEIWNNKKMQEYRKKIITKNMNSFCNKNCLDNLHNKDLFRIR